MSNELGFGDVVHDARDDVRSEDGLNGFDVNYLQLLLTFGAGFLGVAVGFGALRNQVKTNTYNIVKLWARWDVFEGNPGGNPGFVKPSECSDRHGALTKEMTGIKSQLEKQANATTSLQNFAQWFLTTKEKLSIVEVKQILGGE